MAKVINLKKDPYNSSKISVLRGNLYGVEKIQSLAKKEFDEILRYLEEHGFQSSVDKSYLRYEGFYLIERILNDHLSKIYNSVFAGTSKTNKKLLEAYYLKYQVHNLMVVLRCKLANEKEFETYLIGDSRKLEKFIKAYQMPNIEDALIYLAKKLGFDSKEVVEKYEKGAYELENYLYKSYYSKLKSLTFKFNNKDEKLFDKFIKEYIDLLNTRAYLILRSESKDKINFEEVFMIGGSISLNEFEKFNSKSIEDSLKHFQSVFEEIDMSLNSSSIENLDKRISRHKKIAESIFTKSRFGSPFYALRFLFKVEREMNMLRVLLKSKYLKLSKEEIEGLL